MILYLLRHADANATARSDAERSLSDKGVEQARRVGNFCKRHDLRPDAILASPLLRARQTAELFSEECGAGGVAGVEFLSCGMTPEAAMDGLSEYGDLDSVMLVGHEPDFSELAAALTGMPDGDRIRVRKASLIAIDIPALELGEGSLQFSVPVKFLSR